MVLSTPEYSEPHEFCDSSTLSNIAAVVAFREFFVYLAKNPPIEEMHHTLCPSCNCLNDGF